MFDFSGSFKKFKEANGLMDKVLHGTEALAKGVGNVAILATVQMYKEILSNPNSSSEQKAKAKEFLDKHDK